MIFGTHTVGPKLYLLLLPSLFAQMAAGSGSLFEAALSLQKTMQARRCQPAALPERPAKRPRTGGPPRAGGTSWLLSVPGYAPLALEHAPQDNLVRCSSEDSYWRVFDQRTTQEAPAAPASSIPEEAAGDAAQLPAADKDSPNHSGIQAAPVQSVAADNTGCVPWKLASQTLCAAIARCWVHDLSTPPVRVLELGCGVGAIGLFAATRINSNAQVWLTDIDADALALAAVNVNMHSASSRISTLRWVKRLCRCRLSYWWVGRYAWGDPLPLELANIDNFDALIASDVLYSLPLAAKLHGALVDIRAATSCSGAS